MAKDDMLVPIDVSRISFILGVKSDFNYNKDKQVRSSNSINYTTDMISNFILDFMNDHKELEDLSMTVAPVRGLYRYEYGCPCNGEKLYKLTSLYNPLYGQSKKDWYDSILLYAKKLSEFFNQPACTIIIENYDPDHPLQFIYIKNDDTRRML